MEIIKCPICESEKSSVFLHSRDYFLTKEDFEIKTCGGCGFLFTSPMPADAKLGAYYESEEYISHSNAGKGFINILYQAVRNYTLGKKVTLIQKWVHSGKVLDIGCGTGEFLNVMSKKGFDVIGVEPNINAANFAIENYHLSVYKENKLSELVPQSFDVITMWHVLEHVSDLAKRIEQIKKLLKPDGILIVAVPNPESFDARYYKKYWAAFDLPRHLYHFKKSDISKLFKKVEMEIVKVIPMLFDSFYVSLLSEKYKTGSSKYFRAFIIGLWSNLGAFIRTKNYSSLIYIIKHKNA